MPTPTNNILIFDESKANMMSDTDYSDTTSARYLGLQTGVASSELQNKFQYQVSLFAYALSQIMNNNGYDSLDSDTISTFVNNLSSSIRQPKDIPKLKPGVEYLTDEVVIGSDDSVKNVYVKRIEIPDASTFTAINSATWSLVVPHGITNIGEVIEFKNMFVLDDTIYSGLIPDNPPFYASFENSYLGSYLTQPRKVILAKSNIYFNQFPSASITPDDTMPSNLVSGSVILKYTKSA